MRQQNQIDRLAAIAGTEQHHRWKEKAEELGFTNREYFLLRTFAVSPKWVNAVFDEKRKSALLEILGTRPEESLKLVALIRKDWTWRKDDVIRSTILDSEFWPDGYNPPDKIIALEVCKRLNQRKLSGDALKKLIANIKKQRQQLAKRFPAKGKNSELQLPSR